MFKPEPVDTSSVRLPKELLDLTETLARNTHDLWATRKLSEGWRYGPRHDDSEKTHPRLVPYESLPESEKDYDRATAMEALKLIVKLGYSITRDAGGAGASEPKA